MIDPINILGKYSFVLPESVRDGKLRELDNENFPQRNFSFR